MSPHLTPEQLQRFRQHQVTPLELLDLDHHLAACASCREQVRVPRESAAEALRSALHPEPASPLHLEFEQLAWYADGALEGSSLAAVREHLEVCPECTAEVRDLVAFREELAELPSFQPRARRRPQTVGSWFRLALPAATAVVLISVLLRIPLPPGSERRRGDAPVSARASGQSATEPHTAQLGPEQNRVAESHQTRKVAELERQVDELETRLARVLSVGEPASGTESPKRTVWDGDSELIRDTDGRLSRVKRQPVPPEIERAWNTGHLAPPMLLAQVTGVPRNAVEEGMSRFVPPPGSPRLSLRSPVGTAVRTDKPEFTWAPHSGAHSYTVTIFDLDGFALEVSPTLEGTRWQPARPLPRGRTYHWEVAAYVDGVRAHVRPGTGDPEARFAVLDEKRVSDLDRELEAADGSQLAEALIYWRTGLLDHAESGFSTLVRDNPASSRACALLGQLRKTRRSLSRGK